MRDGVDALDDGVLVDGIGDGLADPTVGKERVSQIVTEVGVSEGEIPVLVEIFSEEGVLGLPGVLQRRQVHIPRYFRNIGVPLLRDGVE